MAIFPTSPRILEEGRIEPILIEQSVKESNPVIEKLSALIVGAGPTGLVMANELARDGIRWSRRR